MRVGFVLDGIAILRQRRNVPGLCQLSPFVEQLWQLGDIRGDAARFIERQAIRRLGIARVWMAVDVGEGLSVAVYDFEAAVERFNRPWCRESAHWPTLPRQRVMAVPSDKFHITPETSCSI